MQQVKINDIDLEIYGIRVMKIRGVFDMPGRFGTFERDWLDVDGIEAFVEQADLYYKQRVISITCEMEAFDIGELQYQLGLFREHVYSRFTLETPYSVHDCIMKDGARVSFHSTKYTPDVKAEFTLNCNEISTTFGTTLAPDPDIVNDVFWIDNIALSRFGIVVEESDGNFDFPKMKSDRVTRYMRESDKVNKRETRDISLKCSLVASDITDFQIKMAQFQGLLAQTGLRKLMLPMAGLEKPYEVFCTNGFKLQEFYPSGVEVIGRFTVVLTEAKPAPESFYLTILLDTYGVPILTTDGKYIYIIGDRVEQEEKNVYLFTVSEIDENGSSLSLQNPYLFTDNELDPEHVDFDPDAYKTYLFTKEELEQ